MVADSDLNARAANARERLQPQIVEVLGAGAQAGEPCDGARDQPQTHFPTFRCNRDLHIITRTWRYLEASGFYWGPMTVDAAHSRLRGEPPGTFLLRDSQQRNYFFSLSFRAASEAISIRIQFQDGVFRLDGSKEAFDCVVKLIEHFTVSPKRFLGKPLRRVRLQSLQEICRRRIIQSFGQENTARLPLNPVLRHYLEGFPFRI